MQPRRWNRPEAGETASFINELSAGGCKAIVYVEYVPIDHQTAVNWKIEQGKKYFSVASGGGTGRTLHPDNIAAGPASYGMTDTMGRMHSDVQFAGSSFDPAHVEMMGFLGIGNNPMVGATVAVAVAVAESKK